LHYEIAKQIIKFVNLVPKKSQFIFTTHNIEFMDFSLFRKDQIFLINRKDNDEKEIYKVDNFKNIRKTYNVKELYKA
jgi:AAA15 family ATPase/GTPase